MVFINKENKEGYLAFIQGLQLTDCPYLEGLEHHTSWIAGYLTAKSLGVLKTPDTATVTSNSCADIDTKSSGLPKMYMFVLSEEDVAILLQLLEGYVTNAPTGLNRFPYSSVWLSLLVQHRQQRG